MWVALAWASGTARATHGASARGAPGTDGSQSRGPAAHDDLCPRALPPRPAALGRARPARDVCARIHSRGPASPRRAARVREALFFAENALALSRAGLGALGRPH